MAAKKRKTLSKRLRFEVLKRDYFKCQYCGSAAPDVLLHIDHIKPVAAGGSDDITNLITSCESCNSGKSDKLLGDNAAVSKSRNQLEKLQERREQLELMMEWQEGLSKLSDESMDRVSALFESMTPGVFLSPSGKAIIQKSLDRFSIPEVCVAIRASVSTYVKRLQDGSTDRESVSKALNKILPICFVNKTCQDRPYMRRVYNLKNIMAKRFSYMDAAQALSLLEEAHLAGAEDAQLLHAATRCRNWSQFTEHMEELIFELQVSRDYEEAHR